MLSVLLNIKNLFWRSNYCCYLPWSYFKLMKIASNRYIFECYQIMFQQTVLTFLSCKIL